MPKPKLKVAWFSAGVSSAVACYLERDSIDLFIYIDIDDQHPDTLRFVRDFEQILGKPIQIMKSRYASVNNACQAFGYVNGVGGAKCTEVLKKRVRKEWEREHADYDIAYVWGMDATEWDRAERLLETMPHVKHEFPLIARFWTKQQAHGYCKDVMKLRRPLMYDLGYSNNNCIACVKGGMGYFNRIRIDFPEAFWARAKMERIVGHSCINGVFLDELDPKRGRMSKEIMPDCGIACELNL